MERYKTMKKSIMDIIFYGIIARGLNVIKGLLIAYYIGSNYKLNLYTVTLSTIILFSSVISDGIIISLIPIFQQVDKKQGMEGRIKMTNNAFNSLLVFSMGLIILGLIFAPMITRNLASGLDLNESQEMANLLKLGLFIMAGDFIRALGAGYLQSIDRFRAGARSGVVNSLIYVLLILVFQDRFGLQGLMLISIIAIVGQAAFMIWSIKGIGYVYRWQLDFKDESLRKFYKFLFPVMISIGINTINGVLDSKLASNLVPDSIAGLNYAKGITSLILGLFILAFVNTIAPILTKDYNDMNSHNLEKDINFGFNMLLVVVIPISILLIIFGQPIVSIFYYREGLMSAEILSISKYLSHYAIGLIGLSLIAYIARVYYAIHDTFTPIKLAIITLVSNLALTPIFVKSMGGRGIALATSISTLIAVTYGVYKLNKRFDLFQSSGIWTKS